MLPGRGFRVFGDIAPLSRGGQNPGTPDPAPSSAAASRFHGVRDLAPAVDEVQQREPGMARHHARARVTHDYLGEFAWGFLVAVDRAFRAGRLVFTVGTLFQPAGSVFQKLGAAWAGSRAIGRMMSPAIQAHHMSHGLVLATQPTFQGVTARRCPAQVWICHLPGLSVGTMVARCNRCSCPSGWQLSAVQESLYSPHPARSLVTCWNVPGLGNGLARRHMSPWRARIVAPA